MEKTRDRSRIRLDTMELSWLCGQVALVLKSGIPVQEGIEMLADSADNPRTAAVLRALTRTVEQRQPLSTAMERQGSFPAHMVGMARIGEVSGNLDTVMSGLADFYERSARLSARIRSAMTYPLVLLIMMAAVIVLLVVRVLPIFSNIFVSLGGDMPPFSRGVLLAGLFLQRNFAVLLAAAAGLVAALWVFFRIPAGRRLLDRARLGLPGLRGLYRKIYASRFSMAMSYMLASGIDMDTSLEMAETIMDNRIVAARVADARAAMSRGEEPFAALGRTGIFPRLFIRMLAMGSKAGELDTVMGKVARSYEGEVDAQLNRLTSVIEPLLVVVLSAVVGGILLTVMLPLIDIMSSIG
ncbi:MAG: type II secretion system F family protein [Clostridia bacterium]|nr:type II secretion system F family protein [Clostridia bacterium]